MDRLEEMFTKQYELQKELGTWDKIKCDADRQEFTNQMILAIVEETIEVMRETPYKNPAYVQFGWKINQLYNREAMGEELVDLWHFIMNLALAHGFSANDFYLAYLRKQKRNLDRKRDGY